MKTKKLMTLLMAVIMLLSCLVGCGTPDDSKTTVAPSNQTTGAGTTDAGTTEAETKSLFNEPGTLPIVNETVTLKVITVDQNNPNTGNKTSNSKIWAWLEEKTGVHFEVESYPAEELKQKLPLIMSTPDEMPDLLFRCNLSASDILNYGINGQILMLDDLLEEYAPNIQECFDTVNGMYGASVAADGHFYSLPSYNASVARIFGTLNQQYLDNVGMKAPTTFEELYEVFKAIQAHDDPNGDGIKNNEFCWSDEYSEFRRLAMQMGGLNCYWPWNGCLFDSDGDEVFFALTSDRYKELLTWLNKFYEEGMIDPETFTQTMDEARAKFAENRSFLKQSIADPENKAWNGVEGDFPVALKINKEDTPLITIGAGYQTDIGAVSAYTKYPEVCVMVMDFLFSEEGSQMACFGMEGVDYTVKSKDPLWVLDIDAEHGAGESKSAYAVCVPRWRRDDWKKGTPTATNAAIAELVADYGKFAFQNYLKFTSEESDAIATYSADLGLYCDDYFVGFVNGTYDIEKDWDAYVAECKKMKSEELTAVYQQAYNRFFGVK